MNFLRHHNGNEKKAISFTLAASYDVENATLNFGLAKCCKHDSFCKKRGRELANNRLKNKPTFAIHLSPEANLREVFNEKYEEIKSFIKKKNIKDIKQEYLIEKQRVFNF